MFESLGIEFGPKVKAGEHFNSECEDDFSTTEVKVEIPTEGEFSDNEVPYTEIPDDETPDSEIPDAEIPDVKIPEIVIPYSNNLLATNAEKSGNTDNPDTSKDVAISKIFGNYETIEEYLQAEKTLKCDMCGTKYSNAYGWRRHRQFVHNILPIEKELRLIGRIVLKGKQRTKVCHICLEPVTSFRKGIFE